MLITKKQKNKYFNTIWLICLFATVFIYSLIKYQISSLNQSTTFAGGDLTAEIFAIKIAGIANIFGVTDVVGWPNGFGLWAEPLLGMGPYYVASIFSKLSFTNHVAAIYTLTMATGIALNSISAWWMVAKEFTETKYALFFGLIVGISPFALMRFGHMPVAWLFFPLIFLGVAFRLGRNQISRKFSILILVLTGAWSPLWWTIVVLFIAITVNLILLLNVKKAKKNLLDWLSIASGILISIIPTLILNTLNANYSGVTSRFPWQSNEFGGKFSDILLSSPFLNEIFDLRSELSEGVSPEALNSFVGIVLGLSILYLIIQILINEKIKDNYLPSEFYIISLVTLLFFIVGGFGNLQAGLLVLLNQVSPARTWFRLIFFLGILGFFMWLKIVERSKLKNKTINMIFFGIIAITLLDSRYIAFKKVVNKQDLAEFGAVQFLDSTTKNCPVLQVPIDTFPLNQDFTFTNGSKFAYNQVIPFLLSDNNQWSLFGIPGNKYWEGYKKIPVEINETELNSLQKQGYCAVLFDKEFSEWQISRKAGLDYTQGFWPGLKINVDISDYEDERFKVYLLNK